MNKNIQSYIMPTYGERNLEFNEGLDVYLFSKEKKRYLDFGSGIAVNSLGHCHPVLVKVLQDQASKLWHTSNLYYSSQQEEYAKILCNNSFAEKIFFTNSGVEAIEAGLKVIRSYHYHHNNNQKKNIITFEGAFHGRTFAALSAQNNSKYSKIFEPLLPGFKKIPFNDINILKKTLDENISAVMLEPIQGEGGIRPANLIFLEKVRKLCDDYGILFFLDEVQTGFGRSGKLFAYEWANLEPDIMATAKGIASGFPLGACFSTNEACIGMIKGTHGSTYGGNSLAISVGAATIKIILEKDFLNNVYEVSNYFWNKLKNLQNIYDEVISIRGAGLLLGMQTKSNNIEVYNLLAKNGLLTVPANENVIRFAPPLIVTRNHVDEAIQIIKDSLNQINE